jgi:hypothetical protein
MRYLFSTYNFHNYYLNSINIPKVGKYLLILQFSTRF